MKRKMIMLMTAAMLCGCSSSSSSTATSAATQDPVSDSSNIDGFVVSNQMQTENQSAGIVVLNTVIPAGNGDIVLKPSSVVTYCDPSVSNTFIPYCSKSGCQHNSVDCGAYIGSAESFGVYKDYWYYIDTVDGESSVLYKHDPINNERTVLMTVNTTEENNIIYYVYMNGFMISHDYLYLRVEHDEYNNAEQTSVSYTDIIKMDISTGEYETLITGNNAEESYFLIGGNGVEMVVEHSFNFSVYDPSTDPNAEDPTGDLVAVSDNELLLYNLETMESTVIVDTAKGMQTYSDPYGNICGSDITYILENEIHLYNVDDHSDVLVYTIAEGEELIRANIFGDLIYFITHDENDVAEFWVMNSDGSNLLQLENNGNTDATVFTSYRTTENGYVGLYDSSAAWISVSDCLNENYDNAVSLGA